ncbi:hypothetical protein HZS_2929 [Henneguya salminicola]|nr:hypothetical protein HZS_2929 [Henneguya salminicola]
MKKWFYFNQWEAHGYATGQEENNKMKGLESTKYTFRHKNIENSRFCSKLTIRIGMAMVNQCDNTFMN